MTATLLVLLLSQSTGCATQVIARSRPPAPGPSGNAWELVLESPAASAIAFAPSARPELTRRDEAMNIADVGPTLATDHWPEPPRPSLNHDRRISIPRTDNSYLYFDTHYRRTQRLYHHTHRSYRH